MDADLSKQLLNALQQAEAKFRALGDAPIYSSYSSGPAIAKVLRASAQQLEIGHVDLATQRELWLIFAPTCDWDDVIGDVDLGNKIFALINILFGDGHREGYWSREAP